jgi:hypothetical protein
MAPPGKPRLLRRGSSILPLDPFYAAFMLVACFDVQVLRSNGGRVKCPAPFPRFFLRAIVPDHFQRHQYVMSAMQRESLELALDIDV